MRCQKELHRHSSHSVLPRYKQNCTETHRWVSGICDIPQHSVGSPPRQDRGTLCHRRQASRSSLTSTQTTLSNSLYQFLSSGTVMSVSFPCSNIQAFLHVIKQAYLPLYLTHSLLTREWERHVNINDSATPRAVLTTCTPFLLPSSDHWPLSGLKAQPNWLQLSGSMSQLYTVPKNTDLVPHHSGQQLLALQ